MSDQAALFSRFESRLLSDALARQKKACVAAEKERERYDAAAREKALAKDRRDALCQGFFEVMLQRPISRHP